MLKTFMLAACLLAASALPRPVSAASAAPAIHMFFPWGTAELSAVALQLVDVVKSRVGPASRVSIVGHADTSEADPGALSQARATAVQKALIQAGVPASAKITARGRGTAEPMVKTGPGTREPRNRYVLVTVENPSAASAEPARVANAPSPTFPVPDAFHKLATLLSDVGSIGKR